MNPVAEVIASLNSDVQGASRRTRLRSAFVIAQVAFSLLLVIIAATVIAFWRVRPLAGVLLLPYLVWVAYASALTFAIVGRNPDVLL